MKRSFIVLFLTAALLAPIAASDFGASAAVRDDNPTLEAMLRYAIQDEYLARAEYEQIMETHGDIRPFSNIIQAEESHVGYLVPLFENLGLTVPADTAADHVVVPESLKQAIEIGVQAEIDNIAMYDRFLDQDLPADVRDVFERLKNASENHLRAFRNNLMRYQ